MEMSKEVNQPLLSGKNYLEDLTKDQSQDGRTGKLLKE